MTQIYRNHPVALLKNSIGAVAVLLIISVSSGSYYPMIALAGLVVLLAVSWYANTLTVYEDHAVAEFNFIIKKKTIIPFGKVASVNEVKGLLARIFGCTTVQINVNSAQNAARPDIAYMLRDDIAASIVPLLKYGSGISDAAAKEETEEKDEWEGAVPVFEFGFASAIVFGLVGSSTYALVMSVAWGLFTVVSMFTGSAVTVMTVIMFLATGVLPIVGSILKHGNFRVYRKGTTIRMVYGMITLYDTSFDISKVNAVCIKRAFFPKLAKRCCLQAEVVGINADAKSVTPNVTLLIPENRLAHAMEALFPEFIMGYDVAPQPKEAAYPTYFLAVYLSMAAVAAAAVAYFVLDTAYGNAMDYLYAFVAGCAVFSALLFLRAFLAMRIRRMGYGDSMLTSVNGILDTSEHIMQYSKVQISESMASPRCRKHGLVKIHMMLLSSAGSKRVTTGFFRKEDAEAISERTVEMSGRGLETVKVSNDEMMVLT